MCELELIERERRAATRRLKAARFPTVKTSLAATVDKTVFPGVQGGPLMHVIAAKAVAFKLALGEEFARAMGQKQGCLMRGHGITTAGARIEEATLTAIKLNEVAEINYRASLLGTPEPISQEDIDVLAGKASGKNKAIHSASSWRYYCRLLDE